MDAPMSLRWSPSIPAGWFHAALAVLRGQPLADPALAAALARPAACLRAALLDERIDADRFLGHLVPVASENCGIHDLAEILLVKLIGRTEAASRRVIRFHALLNDIKLAFQRVVPAPRDMLLPRLDALRKAWDRAGAPVLGWVARSMEPGLLVEEASVFAVYPALGGGGTAYLPYNAVCIEAADAPVPGLPEVLRLAWLLSQLNMDLPRYSDSVSPARLETVVGLAMIPMVLTAAEVLEQVACDAATMDLAVSSWMRPGAEEVAWRSALREWWDVYRVMRPAWPTALRALERLVAGERQEALPGQPAEAPAEADCGEPAAAE
jgi:hypothetical protein